MLVRELMESLQVVTRDAGEGVVLHMPLHVPVEEGAEWIETHTAATFTEVIALRLTADMHRVMDPCVIPLGAIEPGQRDHDNQKPLADRDGKDGEEDMKEEL